MPNFLADSPPPPPLPAPPAWEAWLWESLLTGPAVALMAVLLGLLVLPRLGRGRLGLAVAASGLAAGLGLLAWSYLTITPREALLERTRAVIDGIARGDAAPADAAFAPDVRLTLLGTDAGMNRGQMLARISGDMNGRYAVRDRAARLSRARASVDGPNTARTQVRVQAVHDSTGYPASTWWIVHWRRASATGAWEIVNLDLQQFDGLAPGTRISP